MVANNDSFKRWFWASGAVPEVRLKLLPQVGLQTSRPPGAGPRGIAFLVKERRYVHDKAFGMLDPQFSSVLYLCPLEKWVKS